MTFQAYIDNIQAKTGKPTRIGRLRLSFIPSLAVRVDDFVFGNPAGFPTSDLLSARRVYAEVKARDLWNHRIVIESEIGIPLIAVGEGERRAKPATVAKHVAGCVRRPIGGRRVAQSQIGIALDHV